MLGGRQVTRFKRERRAVRRDRAGRATSTAPPRTTSRAIYVRGRDGSMVQLSNLVDVKEAVAPKELNHFNQLRAATHHRDAGAGLRAGRGARPSWTRPRKRVLPVDGADRLRRPVRANSASSAASSTSRFVLALAFIYLVLAAQFESFVDPFVIMLTVPLSMTGALLALWLTGGTLNVYSQIGLVTLVGLITKHGILIVEFANQLREQGAAMLRCRGRAGDAAPAADPDDDRRHGAGRGAAGARARAPVPRAGRQIGWVIVGGMMLGTLLTLFVVPTAYTLLARGRQAEEPLALPAPAE